MYFVTIPINRLIIPTRNILLRCFFATASCTSVEVTGAAGLLSGIYELDGDTGSYIRYGGVSVYVIGKDSSDTWYLGQGAAVVFANDDYPYYYVSQST